ncbi:MAG: ABC transporter permease [Tepidiformaceae bacterium]
MAATATQQQVLFTGPSGNRYMRSTKRFIRTQPLATFGAITLIIALIVAIIGPWVAPKDPYTTSILNALNSPSGENWFGTDNLGRDVFSRVIVATRFSLLLGVVATLAGIVIATILGLFSGYVGGFPDMIIQRLVDAAMGIPFILFLLMVVTMAGASFMSIALVIGFYNGITNSRVIRGSVLGVKEEMYVEAARSVGVPPYLILAKHVLPNVMATIIIITSLSLGASVLAESALSFLGYGVPPPDPTWGQMMGLEARPYITKGPWMAVFPGIALSVVVFSINVLGDGLRDVLDPRLRGR